MRDSLLPRHSLPHALGLSLRSAVADLAARLLARSPPSRRSVPRWPAPANVESAAAPDKQARLPEICHVHRDRSNRPKTPPDWFGHTAGGLVAVPTGLYYGPRANTAQGGPWAEPTTRLENGHRGG